MSFFKFSDEPFGEPERIPERLYGKVDSIEPENRAPGEPFTILIEVIDADYADDFLSEELTNGLPIDDERIYGDEMIGVVSIDISYEHFGLFDAYIEEDAEENLWVILERDPGGIEVEYYFNLFQQPAIQYYNLKILNDFESQNLTSAFSMSALQASSEDEIQAALDARRLPVDSAAVYDVGQGNCNAITDGSGRPHLYYDFGGGVKRNAKTYPPGLNKFCFTQKPIFVLSHWDWDHWSSALRTYSAIPDADAIKSTWILPEQNLGAVHRRFLSFLLTNGTVYIWPKNAFAHIRSGPVDIYRTAGPKRNHDGLVMEFRPGWAQGRGILMTGDCDYSYLPAHMNGLADYDAIIIPHHGGGLKPRTQRNPANYVPGPSAGSYTRLCLSCGEGNSYSHPETSTMNAHIGEGWSKKLHRDTRDRTGTHSGPSGSIWLTGPGGRNINQTLCGGGRCQLCYTQD